LDKHIDAARFKEMLLCADAAVAANVRLINELNVFPVPDGDTGTNMSLTFNTAAAELRKKSFDSVDKVADCAASALLRGARGNSGVILSLLFRGMAKRFKGVLQADGVDLSLAIAEGVDAAYKAVMKPAEGTILTVSRIAAVAAVEKANKGAMPEEVLDAAVNAGETALEDTMNINPVLKKAGVVDAGGKGYIIMLKAMLACLRGEVTAPEKSVRVSEDEESPFDVFDTDEITYAFDTVYIVRKTSENTDLAPLRAYLDTIGDSLVIGEDDEQFKVHVHTNIPGEALTESQKYGTLELAKIENMRTQHDDIVAGRKAQSTDDLEAIEQELENGSKSGIAAPEKKYGVVAVSAGVGMAAVFKELGVDTIVTGGQTMNPSTDDILTEINLTPAETVFVLPNNKNIIMAAEQCIPLTEKKVVVVNTRTVPEGMAAMLAFNPDEDEESIVAEMNEAKSRVHTAMVTYAARDSDFDGHDIHEGEYLALLDGKLIGSYANKKKLFEELNWAFDELNPEFIHVLYGEDVKEEEAQEVSDSFTACFPDAVVSLTYGGQPVYYYTISVE